MIKQGTLENQANIVYLSIGSNLGNKKINIEKAKYLLKSNKTSIIKFSSFYETLSWPNSKFPKFYNVVIKIKTTLSSSNLFLLIKKIEKKLGRVDTKQNSPRTCDIDIIDYNGDILSFKINNNYIEIPHLRLEDRNFVLLPLYEVNKKWVHPKNNDTIDVLLSKLSIEDKKSILKITKS